MADKQTDAEKLNEKLDKLGDHLDSIHARVDEIHAHHGALSDRLDALEGEKEKSKADAAAEEKERADKTRKDAEAETATPEDAAKFAATQMRCDAAYQAWGKQAPHALHGETLRDFAIRLLTPLKRHSKTYADSALHLVADAAAFGAIEEQIIADAIGASSTSYDAAAPLRKISSRTDSGHTITRFIGDPRVGWAEFSGGATKFGRINSTIANAR